VKIIIISPAFPPDRDGVGDYTSVLADGLSERNDVMVITSERKGLSSDEKGKIEIIRKVRNWGGYDVFNILSLCKSFSPDMVIIQYVSFLYGRGGINLIFPLISIILRMYYKVLTMIHEPFVSFEYSIKQSLMSLVQKGMLFFIVMGSDKIAVSILAWNRMLKKYFFWRKKDFVWIPVSSNIRIASEFPVVKRLNGFGRKPLLVFFGSLHFSKMIDFVFDSLDALIKKGYDAGLIVIGHKEDSLLPSITNIPSYIKERVLYTGYCSNEEASKYLSMSDMFLLPLIDGVSSRRTTVMAALKHGVPVVTTSGFLTDEIFLRESFTVLSPSNNKESFLKNVERLAEDESLRKSIGKKGRDAYNKYFSEKLMVDRYIDHALTIPKIKWCWGMKISDQLILESIYEVRKNIRGILLDIGCGKKPYHPLLNHKTVKWVGIDRAVTHSGLSSADIFGDGKYLPFKSEAFDTVLCTQVIEHIDEPDILFKEISRVLKKSGMLIMTAPQTNYLHEEPHDYYRFTKYGLAYLANKYGLGVELIKPLGGVFALLGQTISAHIPLIRKPRFAGEILRGLLQGICNFIFWYLDRIKEVPESTIGYILTAKKKE